MRRSMFVLAWLASAGIASPAAADPTPDRDQPTTKVAIVPGIAVNLDAAKVDGLSQDLAEALTAELTVIAVGGLEVRRQLPPDGVAPDCVTTPACVNDVAKKLNANQLLFVVMVDTGSGGSIQIDSTWVDVSTGKTSSRPPIDVTSPSVARARFADSAHQLLPDAPLRPKAKDRTLVGGKPRHITLPAYITAGVGVVGLGIGVSFAFDTRAKYDHCNNDGVLCSDARKSSIRHIALAADAGFFLAVAGAIATGILYAGSAESPHVVIQPTPTGGTIGAAGSF